MSAGASDMSGWLLMGLPGAAYLSGYSAGWIGIGLALGTFLNWQLVAKRFRVYTEIAGDSITISDYFENRFRDDSRILGLYPPHLFYFSSLYIPHQDLLQGQIIQYCFWTRLYPGFGIRSNSNSCIYCTRRIFGSQLDRSFPGTLMFIALVGVPIGVFSVLAGKCHHGLCGAINPNFLNLFKIQMAVPLGFGLQFLYWLGDSDTPDNPMS